MAKNRHSHYQSDREHEATHDLDEARVVGVELRRATLDDLREETAKGEQDTGGELQGGTRSDEGSARPCGDATTYGLHEDLFRAGVVL